KPIIPIQIDIIDVISPKTSIPQATKMTEHGKVIAAYFAAWSIYARKFFVQDIDYDKLTHILYAFANIKNDGEVFLGDPWSDTDIHFDGDSWNDNSTNFSAATSSNKSRENLVDSVVKLMNDLGLDGLDNLREALDQYTKSKHETQHYLLTTAVPCGEDNYK
ncbi:11326_t:CDS:2, partial [Entrophospora sp. SA101]